MEKQIYHLQIMSLRNHCFFHGFSQCFFHGFPYLGLSQVAVTPQGLDTDLDPQVLGIFVVSIMGILWDTIFSYFEEHCDEALGLGVLYPYFIQSKSIRIR